MFSHFLVLFSIQKIEGSKIGGEMVEKEPKFFFVFFGSRSFYFLRLKDVSVFFWIMANSTPDDPKVNEDNSGTNKSCARF